MAAELKLGLGTGYWSAGPPGGAMEAIAEADELGFDSMWTAEAYGSDALTPLAWWGSQTKRIKLGTSIVQISARQPAATAMAAMTMDHLSGGRFILGLGVSGPQVVEGWYGQAYPKPLARTREYVEIVREIVARKDRVTAPGPAYTLPYPGGTGLGQAAEVDTAPAAQGSADLPRRRGPEEHRVGAEIADGWLALFYSPHLDGFYRPRSHEGFARGARAGLRTTSRSRRRCRSSSTTTSSGRPGSCARCSPCTSAAWARATPTSTPTCRCAWATRTRSRRSRTSTSRARRTRRPPRSRSRSIEEIALIGPKEKIRDDLEAWRESFVTTLLVSGDAHTLRRMAELVLG